MTVALRGSGLSAYSLSLLGRLESTVASWDRAAAGTVDDGKLYFVWYVVARMCFSFPRGSPYLAYGWDERGAGATLAKRLESMMRARYISMEGIDRAIASELERLGRALDACESALNPVKGLFSIDLEPDEFEHDVMYRLDMLAYALLLKERFGASLPKPTQAGWAELQERLRPLLPRILEHQSTNDYVAPRNREASPDSFWWWRLYPALQIDPAITESQVRHGDLGYSVRQAGEILDSIEEPTTLPKLEVADVANLLSGLAWLRILATNGRIAEVVADENLCKELKPRLDDLVASVKSVDQRLRGALSSALWTDVERLERRLEWTLGRREAGRKITRFEALGGGSIEELIESRDALEFALLGAAELATPSPPSRGNVLEHLDAQARGLIEAAARRDPGALGALLHGSFPPSFWWRDRGALLR